MVSWSSCGIIGSIPPPLSHHYQPTAYLRICEWQRCVVHWYNNVSRGDGLDFVHRICLSCCFQSICLTRWHGWRWHRVHWLPPNTNRSRPWQDPMRDWEFRSQPLLTKVLTPPTKTRRSTKTTQLENRNAGAKKGGGGGKKQIPFDAKLVNGYLTHSMLWGVYGLWLSGPVCTEVMHLWEGSELTAFSRSVWFRPALRHSYHSGVTVERGVTLWKHTQGPRPWLLFPVAVHCSCSSQKDNKGAATGLAASESNSEQPSMQN